MYLYLYVLNLYLYAADVCTYVCVYVWYVGDICYVWYVCMYECMNVCMHEWMYVF